MSFDHCVRKFLKTPFLSSISLCDVWEFSCRRRTAFLSLVRTRVRHPATHHPRLQVCAASAHCLSLFTSDHSSLDVCRGYTRFHGPGIRPRCRYDSNLTRALSMEQHHGHNSHEANGSFPCTSPRQMSGGYCTCFAAYNSPFH